MTDGPVTLGLPGARGLRLEADGWGAPPAPPVLLWHGGGQTRHAWGGLTRVLGASGWRALTVDLRGHGASGWPDDADYSVGAFAEDVVAAAAGFEQRPALVGASLGGLASLIAVGESAEPLATALVLVDVAPRMEVAGQARIAEFMHAHLDEGFADLEEVADAIAAYDPQRPRPTDLRGLAKNLRRREDGRWAWHWDPRFVQPAGDDLSKVPVPDQQRLEEAARAVDIPLLVVRGRHSDLLSEEGLREIVALCPHAETVDIAGAGHMVAADRNDRFNDAVVGFLRRHHQPVTSRTG
jgi:pimeloyl-ACP methyl ester carboxylesterase